MLMYIKNKGNTSFPKNTVAEKSSSEKYLFLTWKSTNGAYK